MSRTSPSWYIRPAGAQAQNGYGWLAIDADGDPSAVEPELYRELAGRPLVDLTSRRAPSVVLGRTADRGFVFYANRLGAPVKGDQHVPSTSLLGVAPPGVDPTPLATVAGAALTGELAAWLPLSWVNGRPSVDLAAGQWPPPAPTPGAGVGRVAMRESLGLPPDAAPAVADTLAKVTGDDLAAVSPNRLVVLSSEVLAGAELEALRPWRAVSPLLRTEVTYPRDRKSVINGHAVLAILAALAVASTVWLILSVRG